MDVYVMIRSATLPELREDVRRFEDLGVTGVLVPDHLFISGGGPRSLDDCPYALLGEPERMAAMLAERRARLGLGAVLLGSNLPKSDFERLCHVVIPRAG